MLLAGGAFLVGVVIVILAERLMRRTGRVGSLVQGRAGANGLNPDGRQRSAEETARMRRRVALLQAVQRGEIVRVIAIQQRQRGDRIDVELPRLEVREAGVSGSYHVLPGTPFSLVSDDLWNPRPAPLVEDEVGTTYAVAIGAQRAGVQEGRTGRVVDFVFAPVPPADARKLRLSIPALDPSSGRQEPGAAPWRIEITL